MKWRTLALISSLALALSTLLHVALLASAARRAPPPSPSCLPSIVAPPAPSPSTARATGSCAEELERCRDRGWELARRVIAEQAQRAAPRLAEDAPAADVTRREERDALCAKGLESLREGWSRDRDRTIANLKRSLADAGEQERNAASEANAIGDAIALPSGAREAFARDYRGARLARMKAIEGALGADPPDLDGAVVAARSLFGDEDALAERYGGEAARFAWRRHQLAGRTIVLAIGAAMADRDLDEATGW